MRKELATDSHRKTLLRTKKGFDRSYLHASALICAELSGTMPSLTVGLLTLRIEPVSVVVFLSARP